MKQDIYRHVTDRIIADLEKGELTWIKPWSGGNTDGNPLTLLFDPNAGGESSATSEAWTIQRVRTPLLLPDEIHRFFARDRDAQIVLINGQAPMVLGR